MRDSLIPTEVPTDGDRWIGAGERPEVRSSRPPADRQRGATLVEITAALGLLAITFGAGASSFGQARPTYAAHGASRQLFGDMQKARITAVASNHRQILRITNAHTYTLHDDVNNNGTIDTGETVTTVDLQLDWPGVTVGAVDSIITFLPNGSTSAAVTSTVTAGAYQSKTITVDQTGRIHLS